MLAGAVVKGPGHPAGARRKERSPTTRRLRKLQFSYPDLGVGRRGELTMKMILLALCLAAVVASVAFVWPMVGGQFIGGPTPGVGDIRDSVFKGLPRGLH